jgi:hypothetical protein
MSAWLGRLSYFLSGFRRRDRVAAGTPSFMPKVMTGPRRHASTKKALTVVGGRASIAVVCVGGEQRPVVV